MAVVVCYTESAHVFELWVPSASVWHWVLMYRLHISGVEKWVPYRDHISLETCTKQYTLLHELAACIGHCFHESRCAILKQRSVSEWLFGESVDTNQLGVSQHINFQQNQTILFRLRPPVPVRGSIIVHNACPSNTTTLRRETALRWGLSISLHMSVHMMSDVSDAGDGYTGRRHGRRQRNP